MALAIGISAGVAWWFSARPAALYRQARQQFAGDPQRAAELLELAVAASDGDYPKAQLLWTRALLRTGRWDEALGCFSFIREPGSLDADELLTLTDEALAAGVPLLAAYAVNAVPVHSPRWPDALQRKLALCRLQQNWPCVAELGAQLTTLDPLRAEAWRLLGEAHERLMNPPQAAIAYRNSLEREPDAALREPVLRRLIHLLIELGDADEARRQTWQLSAIRPLTAEDKLLEAKLQRLEGNLEAAWQTVHSVLESTPGDLQSLELRGALALDRGELNVARRDLEAVLSQQPWNKPAHYKLGQMLIRMGQPEAARQHLDENRRLTALSLRILELQSKTAIGQAEIDRLTELAAAFEQIGQRETASRLRQQARQPAP
jgi:tetratricopeptide (TPR) repeat protein